ncbi:hypothetical protein Ancab_022446 [Ancistrocladus abbreviatus]
MRKDYLTCWSSGRHVRWPSRRRLRWREDEQKELREVLTDFTIVALSTTLSLITPLWFHGGGQDENEGLMRGLSKAIVNGFCTQEFHRRPTQSPCFHSSGHSNVAKTGWWLIGVWFTSGCSTVTWIVER